MEKFWESIPSGEEYYQAVKLKKNGKDITAVIKFFPDKNKFTYKIIPDTIIQWDTIKIDADPIIV
jgi:hypothetical protein